MTHDRFYEVFPQLPVIGMIHLAGDDPVERAVDELAIYEQEGVDGAIIENYHGEVEDVVATLERISCVKSDVKLGVNILPNEYFAALTLSLDYRVDFIQMDHVAGTYLGRENNSLDVEKYTSYREKYPGVAVLGGVWPKYYHPIQGSILENDLLEGIVRTDAIVVTGEGTGSETPLDKVKTFKRLCDDHPLIVGAGITLDNAYKQLSIADGCIVGSYFKHGNDTRNGIDVTKVRDLMSVVRGLRAERR